MLVWKQDTDEKNRKCLGGSSLFLQVEVLWIHGLTNRIALHMLRPWDQFPEKAHSSDTSLPKEGVLGNFCWRKVNSDKNLQYTVIKPLWILIFIQGTAHFKNIPGYCLYFLKPDNQDTTLQTFHE